MGVSSSRLFLPLERHEGARRERVKGRGDRKELREKGKRCTVTEERQKDWKTECGANECTEKKSKRAGEKQYHGQGKGEKKSLYKKKE